ncbi:MAG: protein-glutamate methylesterase/protein-glutamine glutaminase [Isosphaeraceae bacterium]
MAPRDRATPANLPPDSGQIEVLIVDDSAVVRQRLKSIIESDPRFRVVLASDPYEAVERLKTSVPGVIVLDVEMPRMDGLTFLRKLMRQHPMPVVLCTTQAERAVTALEMGAVEVIAKPDWTNANRMADWSQNLLESIRNAARAGHLSLREDRTTGISDRRYTADAILPRHAYARHAGISERIIVVGISTGGVQALQQLLPGFSVTTPGIVIVQHMPQDFIPAFAQRLHNDPRIALEVAEARQHEPVRAGRALVIPGDKHGLIRRAGAGYRVELVDGPPVCRHRPSVEVLFRSAAQAAGPFATGVIMTGMGDDGAGGLLEMREAGSLTIAQNEATCTVFGMPREAIRRGAAKVVAPLDSIAATITAWIASGETGTWH